MYKYKFVPQISATPALGAPQIFEVDLNDRQLTPHGRIQIRVVTTPDVVKVISRSGGREGTLTMVAPGEFVADGGLPGIPFIARGWKINIEFVATNAEGKTADVKVPVTLG